MRIGVTALARALGVSREQVYRYAKAGKITTDPDGKYDADQVALELGRNLKAKVGGEPRTRDRQAAALAPPVTIRPTPPAPDESDDDPNVPSLE